MKEIIMSKNLGDFEEPLHCFEINHEDNEDMKIFDGVIGFKFFKEERYADDFIKGKFRTMPMDWYAQLENKGKPYYDPEEGMCSYLQKIDITKEYQVFKHMDGKELIFFTGEAERDANKRGETLKGHLLQYKAPLSNHIFCFTWCYYNDLESTFKDGKAFSELKQFGKYVIWFSVKDFFKNCSKDTKCQFIGGGPVSYNDILSNHYLIKKKEFENQHEFRVMFLENQAEPLDHVIEPFCGKQAGKIII